MPTRTDADMVPVQGLPSVAHLFPKARGRCGVYTLHFANGEQYIGQAVDVSTRFHVHRRTYADIVAIQFQVVPRGDLDTVEQTAIRDTQAAGVPLRNVTHALGRLYASPFDALVTIDEQHRWLHDQEHPGLAGSEQIDTRVEAPAQRQRHLHRFQRLIADPRFGPVVPALRRYVAAAIPFPRRTERSYWTISAQPATNRHTFPRLFTLSVQTVETFYLCTPRAEPDELMIVMNVDADTILDATATLRAARRRLRPVSVSEATYRARPRVLALEAGTAADVATLLADPLVISAARRLNLDLMRKGPTMHWKTHCFALADLLIG